MFDTVLVANRGEIARRIIRTVHALGIRSVAVHSDADADAPHVREASAGVRIGRAPAAESYLDVSAVIAAAHGTGAQAIHPGYGFLSESAELAAACEDAGIVFIGPSIEALQIMGDKARSREHVAARGVPIVPGLDAAGLSDAEIAARAAEIGYPLLVKPSAGGGGKGMEAVGAPAELLDALASARRVAAASFGDDALILERLIARPRHLEVQVFGDRQGSIVAIGDRECTLQRRHQKVIEEAPAPGITASLRERLHAQAVQVAASVDYVGAGTVEFLIDADAADEPYFIEMNTRLQVEHPVTEAVTGLDLVELQLRIAAGEPLPPVPAPRGHAVEARVYAESPERGFLPSTGTVLRFDAPRGVRVDAAVETGSEVTGFYDPMIAKVIAHAPDRAAALARLDAALADTVVLGVDTNIGFLRALCADERVRAGAMDTGVIATLLPVAPVPPTERMLCAAALVARRALHGEAESAGVGLVRQSTSHGESWRRLRGWRIGGDEAGDAERWFRTDEGALYRAPEEAQDESAALPCLIAPDGAVWVAEAGRSVRLHIVSRRELMERRLAARHPRVVVTAPEARAPMPGSVVAVHVVEGARVRAGDALVSIEAMKMEHPVTAPHDGAVHLLVALGDQVGRDQTVARVDAEQNDD